MIARILFMLASACLFSGLRTAGAPSSALVNGRQLVVQKRLADGSLGPAMPYVMRGVNWSPASTNLVTSPTDPENANRRRPEFAKWFATDLPLLRSMNANTIRVPMDFGVDAADGASGRAVLDACAANGIMVVMTVDNGVNDTNRARRVVNFYQDHPAILAWSLGNEWNINRYYGAAATIGEAAQRTEAAAALIKTLDPNHPVVSSYGEIDINQAGLRLADTSRYVNETCRSVDLWSLNIYRGKSFGSLFAQWVGISTKPMFLGEYGIDAFHSTTTINPNPPGAVNEAEQAEWDAALWRNLAGNLSASDPRNAAIGGNVHEFNDQWWKIAPATSQQSGGLISATGFPDGMSSEEIFGVCDIFRKPRAAYDALRLAYATESGPAGKTLVVTTLANSGAGSLRQTMTDAQAGDMIAFAPALGGTITFAGEIRVTKDLTVSGPGTNRLTLSGNNVTRLFTVSTGVVLRISGVTITRGSTVEYGGAIDNRGALELVECRFPGNFAGAGGDGVGQGGAIYNGGSLVVDRCYFTDNRATGNGGAIRGAGEISIRNSYFAGNRANYYGGAIYNFDSATVLASILTNNTAGPAGGGIWNENSGLAIIASTMARNSAQQGGAIANKNGAVLIENSTLSLNNASAGGGAIFNGVFQESGGLLVIANSTIASNTAVGSAQGGGLRVGSGTVALRSSLLAANSPNDCTGAIASEGFNLISISTGASGLASSDQIGSAGERINAFLGPLRDNGGSTPTHALGWDSPAIDKGFSFGRAEDQRGEPRFDDSAVANARFSDGSDIGAYEAGEPRFFGVSFDVLSTRVAFSSTLGRETVLQRSGALSPGEWTSIATNLGSGSRMEIALPLTASNSFFRLRLP